MPHRLQSSLRSQIKTAARDGNGLSRNQTIGILSVALAMRLLVIWDVLRHYPPQWLYTRGIEMGLLARSLLAGQGLSSPFGGNTGPTAFIAPIYPLLIAGIFRTFGSFTIASAVVIMLAQASVNLLTIWLIMHVARRLWGQAAATLSGLIWACSLPLAWMPTIFWETSLSCCLLIGSIALALKYRDIASLTVTHWIGLGAYFGFGALVNPALLPSLIAIALWLVFQLRSRSGLQPLLAALAFGIVFSPWPLRNAKVFHAFIPLRTTVGFELWMGNHPGADGFLDETLFPMYNQAELADYEARGEVAYSAHKSELAKDFVHDQPLLSARMTAMRAWRFWTGTGSRNGSWVFALHAVFTTVCGFTGIWLLARSKGHALAILSGLPLLIFPLPYLITHAEFRYRLVLDPLLTLLSGYAITQLYGYLASSPEISNKVKNSASSPPLSVTGRTV